ncbi:unnamed protein product [Spodoptera exigua]|nr:unnamed protein product [Spodoptera exigua]
MFLAELTRKLAMKKKQEEESPKNIVQTIIDSITNALPVKLSKKSPQKCLSPIQIETLQTFAPELTPKDTINFPLPTTTTSNIEDVSMEDIEISSPPKPGTFKMPKMPLVNSDILKASAATAERERKNQMQDQSVNTGTDHDVASEIAKHVGTLRKISLIAEEFNQKTAKNLKEIVDSVQEDLIKKLEEIQAEQKANQDKHMTITEDESVADSDD